MMKTVSGLFEDSLPLRPLAFHTEKQVEKSLREGKESVCKVIVPSHGKDET